MAFLQFLSPRRAYLDLRDFLSRRRPHQFVFASAAVALTGLALFEIAHDSHYVAEYHRNIIYVQQWPADRSEAQILAQQKIDKVADDKREAEIKAAQDKQQAAFKRIDDGLKKYGI
ncbi:hypothetical protein [uncultured Sphingomonas sp.]|uniref:hypothetical protein n=1 Tax=uncultured Sphingomonas sp. TaxID=158754 RepID=UPI0035CA2367